MGGVSYAAGYELAYVEARRALEDQDALVAGLGSRAGVLPEPVRPSPMTGQTRPLSRRVRPIPMPGEPERMPEPVRPSPMTGQTRDL